MARRATSPAASEAEVDILDSLFTNDTANPADREAALDGFGFDAGDILDAGEYGGYGDDGDEAFISQQQAASFRKSTNLKGKTVKKGGGFQVMGLNANLLRAITRKGFSVPTPIQRKTIPLILSGRDVVGMARTGSGKTGAFVIPIIERLRAHSGTYGARALILSPSRELALQTLKVVKEFSRGTDLKCVLLVGGDSLEEQFSVMTANPDVVIATPGRFLHLKVEMSLDLSSIKYVVFDEADRLFEMGFATQLLEILHALPPNRKSMLFSATLPQSLAEFTHANLHDPELVRLDAESKMSPDLESAFFGVKGAEKEGVLLHILHDIIKMPVGLPEGVEPESDKPSKKPSKKRKRDSDASRGRGKPTKHSTIVFASTKHHVEYLAAILRIQGFAVSYVYGSLDQTARKEQVENFRRGHSNILVVTDVAARGVDIPILANVINYDFPPQPKIFVHRVGRTARAGQRGWSYSLVRDTDTPYLIDLQLFLSRRLMVGKDAEASNYAQDVVVGAPRGSQVGSHVEWLNKLLAENDDIAALRKISQKAEKLYLKTRNSASSQSAKRGRMLVASKNWSQLSPLYAYKLGDGEDAQAELGAEDARAEMLAKINGYRPQETVFESKEKRAKGVSKEAAEIMSRIRKTITPRNQVKGKGEEQEADDDDDDDGSDGHVNLEDDEDDEDDDEQDDDIDASGSEFDVTVTNTQTTKKDSSSFADSEIFMSYTPRTINAAEERGYGVHSGGNFVEAARSATMDLTNDEGARNLGIPTRARMRWDQKGRKYVSRDNDEDGSRGARLVRGESGVKIAASFQSGRFDKWRKAQRLGKLPRVGEAEKRSFSSQGPGPAEDLSSGPRYKHRMEKAPKEADKYRDDYLVRKKRVAEAREKRVGKFKDGPGSRKEVKGIDDVRKARKEKERKRAKNARPVRKKGRN